MHQIITVPNNMPISVPTIFIAHPKMFSPIYTPIIHYKYSINLFVTLLCKCFYQALNTTLLFALTYVSIVALLQPHNLFLLTYWSWT